MFPTAFAGALLLALPLTIPSAAAAETAESEAQELLQELAFDNSPEALRDVAPEVEEATVVEPDGSSVTFSQGGQAATA